MRNLTKVLAMVLAFTMMVSVAAFAATYTDVASDANYAEAVSVLSDLGLVKGYEDGTFGADKTLTRAEAATLVVRLMGLEDAAVSAAGSDTGFTDVPADHWASGYITVAASKSVVAGMGNGTFEPETELEYAQIVKMIVVALGYEPQAAEAGEWPTNYISTASNIGLTKGIAGKASDKVTRATTARLLYAALTIPKMAKSGVGVTATFEPTDTLILDDLGIYKLLGSVTAVDAVEGKVTLDIDKQGLAIDAKYKETSDDDKWSYDPEDDDVETGVLTATLKGMIDVPAYIFVADVDGDLTVVSIVERKNISSVAFTSEDFDEYDAVKNKLTYYTNIEQTKTASVKLADTVEVRINNGPAEPVEADDFDDLVKNGAYLVDLKDTAENDDKFDYAKLTLFTYMVVGEIDVNKDETVYTFKAEEDFEIGDVLGVEEFEIDLENEEAIVTIIKGDEIVTPADIAEGDILNLVVEDEEGDELIEATIYVTNDTVDGVVQYVDDVDDIIVLEDGTEFKYLNDYGVDSNTEATFYFNISGKLIYVGDETSVSAFEYGFATNVEFAAKRGTLKTGTLRVLKTDGEWATLDLKATVKVNGKSTKITNVDTTPEISAFVDTFMVADGNVYDETADELIITYNDVIAYKLDATGAVKEIVNIVAGENIVEDDEDTEDVDETIKNPIINNLEADKKFSEDAEDGSAFGGYLVDETTVVFNLVGGYTPDTVYSFDETKVSVADIKIFEDGTEYEDVDFIDIDEKTDFVSVISGSFAAAIDFEANYFVVGKVLKRTIEDEEVLQLTGVQNGEVVTYYYSADREPDVKKATFEDVVAFAGVDYDDFGAGDILIVNADANGYITTAAYLASVTDFVEYVDEDDDEDEYSSFDVSDFAEYADVTVEGEDEGVMFAGFVAKKSSRTNRFYVTDTVPTEEYEDNSEDEVNFKGAVVTTYDFTEKKVADRVSDSSKILEGSVVFGRVDEDGKVKEVVVIITDFTEDYDA